MKPFKPNPKRQSTSRPARRVACASRRATSVTYALDAAGNLSTDGLRTFHYDATNRLSKTQASDSDEAAKVSYAHNAAGQRVFKSEPMVETTAPNESALGADFITWLKAKFGWAYATAQTNATLGTAYVYDEGANLLGEYGNGGVTSTGRTEYIWLPTESGQSIPVGMFRNNRFYAIHTDHLGTPRQVTDDTNKAVWQWPYSAFGDNKPTGILKATANPNAAITNSPVLLAATSVGAVLNLRFPGQYFDAEANLNYNYFRSYQAYQGRYTQADPIGLDGGANRFGYVEANPLGSLDPWGLQSQTNLFEPGDPANRGAMLIPPGDTNDVYGHGGTSGMWQGPLTGPGGRYLPPKELADMLRKDPKFRPDLPTRLLGCNVGKGAYCQSVAKELGGKVQCFDETVWYGTKRRSIFWEEGTVTAYPKIYPDGPKKPPTPDYARPASPWLFDPRK